MNEDTTKSYTIRLPERIASRLEANATEAGITPTTLIRSLVASRFESGSDSAKEALDPKTAERQTEASIRPRSDYELRQEQRYRQLLYEIGKMRSVVLHSLDHTLGADQVDDIIEASERTAREYVEELSQLKGGTQ